MTSTIRDIPLEPGAIDVRALRDLIGKPDPVIVEVGANVGQSTEEFLREMPGARIYCFEPDPRAIRKFRERINSPNVTLFECAVGNANGVVTFHQSTGDGEVKDWDQSGSIRAPKRHREVWPMIKFETRIEVPITRLDDWATQHNIESVDLIWADTQGAESDLIAGGLSVLRNTRFLYTEYSNQEWYEGQASLNALSDTLSKLDLHLIRLFRMDALFSNHALNKPIFDRQQGKLDLRRNAVCPCGSGEKFKHCHGRLG